MADNKNGPEFIVVFELRDKSKNPSDVKGVNERAIRKYFKDFPRYMKPKDIVKAFPDLFPTPKSRRALSNQLIRMRESGDIGGRRIYKHNDWYNERLDEGKMLHNARAGTRELKRKGKGPKLNFGTKYNQMIRLSDKARAAWQKTVDKDDQAIEDFYNSIEPEAHARHGKAYIKEQKIKKKIDKDLEKEISKKFSEADANERQRLQGKAQFWHTVGNVGMKRETDPQKKGIAALWDKMLWAARAPESFIVRMLRFAGLPGLAFVSMFDNDPSFMPAIVRRVLEHMSSKGRPLNKDWKRATQTATLDNMTIKRQQDRMLGKDPLIIAADVGFQRHDSYNSSIEQVDRIRIQAGSQGAQTAGTSENVLEYGYD